VDLGGLVGRAIRQLLGFDTVRAGSTSVQDGKLNPTVSDNSTIQNVEEKSSAFSMDVEPEDYVPLIIKIVSSSSNLIHISQNERILPDTGNAENQKIFA
jgi:hypothetical protein